MGEMLCEIMRPEAGTPLDQAGYFRGPFASGAPAICIDTVAKMGHKAGIIGGVGKDDFGKCITSHLKEHGVDCSYVGEYENGSTGVAFVTYFEDGSRKFIFHLAGTPATMQKAPETMDLSDAKYFHIMGCSLTSDRAFAEEILKTMKLMKKSGVKVSFDPNIRPELMHDEFGMYAIASVMENCSVFLPGEEELMLVSGEKTIEGAVKKCFENPVLEVIGLKQGSRGCTIYTREGKFSVGTYKVDVQDTTGAGDSFDGTLLCALVEGRDLLTAAKMASAAAALNTAAFGPAEGRITHEKVMEIAAQL